MQVENTKYMNELNLDLKRVKKNKGMFSLRNTKRKSDDATY